MNFFKEDSRFPILILFLLCLFSYSNVFSNGFISDDYIMFNQIAGQNNVGLGIFTQALNGFYRPVAFLLFKSLFFLFGIDRPWGYHVVNVFLLFAICWLIFLIVQALPVGQARKNDRYLQTAFVAACLFAVHPVNSTIANHKIWFNNTVIVIFLQLSFLFFLKYVDGKKKDSLILSLLFLLGGLFSHEACCIFPVYIFLASYFLRNLRRKELLTLVLPYAACVGFFLAVRANIGGLRLGHSFFFQELPFQTYAAMIAKLLGWYVGKLFFPCQLLFIWDVPIPTENLLIPIICLTAVLILLGVLFDVFNKKRKNVELFALSLWVIGFFPLFLGAFTYTAYTHTAIIEPHWFYFSSIGFFILIAGGLVGLAERWQSAGTPLIILLILGLGIVTWQSNKVWKNAETYCRYWIKLNPYNATPVSELRVAGEVNKILENYAHDKK